MNGVIEAILFDVGGTLRRVVPHDEATQDSYVKKILDLLHLDLPVGEFKQTLIARARAYRDWSKETLLELNAPRLWAEWMLPDFPAEKVIPVAVELNEAWRNVRGTQVVIPGTRETILALFRRGYRLGVVSNTTSSVDVPVMLEKEGLSGCFETVILSCVEGIRKPGAEILRVAAARMGVQPQNCAYVGNLPERDVAAARNAGFARALVLRSPAQPVERPTDPANEPDQYIDTLAELLQIFPALEVTATSTAVTRKYAISLSTMWGIQKFDQLGDMFLAAPRLGFSGVELNHQVTPSMLEDVDLASFPVTGIHEPCPAVISADTLKKQDILISSPDEERRRQGVESIRRSIDLAKQLGAKVIVIHAGMVQFDPSWEKRLVALFNEGGKDTEEYQEIKQVMQGARSSMVNPCLQAVEKSLHELLDYAGNTGIRLGLENRYHYFDIPSPDEMAHFLTLAEADRLGFIYDTGHAHAMDQLGFYPAEEWLRRFADRIILTHLHDAVGVDDHQTPGLGNIDFKMVAGYLPATALRTMEVQRHHDYEQIRQGIQNLVDTGCVHTL